jgi:hypothetical protein
MHRRNLLMGVVVALGLALLGWAAILTALAGLVVAFL